MQWRLDPNVCLSSRATPVPVVAVSDATQTITNITSLAYWLDPGDRRPSAIALENSIQTIAGAWLQFTPRIRGAYALRPFVSRLHVLNKWPSTFSREGLEPRFLE